METLLQGKSFVTGLDEQIVYDQLDGDDNAVWSLLLAAGYLKDLKPGTCRYAQNKDVYAAVTNLETLGMFEAMVKGWFKGSVRIVYNEFIKAMLSDNVRMMNKNQGSTCPGIYHDRVHAGCCLRRGSDHHDRHVAPLRLRNR